jgi:hypothetical protein
MLGCYMVLYTSHLSCSHIDRLNLRPAIYVRKSVRSLREMKRSQTIFSDEPGAFTFQIQGKGVRECLSLSYLFDLLLSGRLFNICSQTIAMTQYPNYPCEPGQLVSGKPELRP